MIEGAEPIFPLEIVRKMRDQRCSLIQTPVSGQFDDYYMRVALDVLVCGLLFIFVEAADSYFFSLGAIYICSGSSIEGI